MRQHTRSGRHKVGYTGWDTNGVGYKSGALPELDTREMGHLQVQSGIHKLRCSRSGTLNEIHTEWGYTLEFDTLGLG